jgi:hypothetical protein
MKNFNLFKTVIIAGAIFVVACEPEEYNIYLPDGSDTTIVNNYYYNSSDSMANAIINYLENFFPERFGDVNYYTVDLQGDCNIVVFYNNEDADSVFTDNVDLELGNVSLCDKGYLPSIDTNIFYSEEGCRIFDLYIGGDFFYSDTLCPQFLPGDTVLVYDTVFVGGKVYAREIFYEDCNNSGNSYYYASQGWNLGEGFSINQIGTNSGNGTIVEWENYEHDTIWSPELFSEPMDIDSISLIAGSRNGYSVKILLKASSGKTFSLPSEGFPVQNENFDWQNFSVPESYSRIWYHVSIENIEFKNIVKIGLVIEAGENFYEPKSRNDKFNADNIYARGVKKSE